jgi:DNA-binding NtrC family response regulator
MATRKTMFEVVKLADIAPLLRDVAVLGYTEEKELQTRWRPARILSVTYDTSLATTREMLFASAGFQVSSVLTVGQAIQLCADEEFALVVIGHSMPMEHKKWLLKELRSRCAAPVLAVTRPGESQLPGADYIFDSTESPALLLETVVNILTPKTGSGGNPTQTKSWSPNGKETKIRQYK